MIEPYIGIGLNMSVNRDNLIIPYPSILGGAQWGVKLGENGAIFVDTRFGWDIGNGEIPERPDVAFHRYAVTVGIGYKFGFFNRLTETEVEIR
jgi:hypothetical protein